MKQRNCFGLGAAPADTSKFSEDLGAVREEHRKSTTFIGTTNSIILHLSPLSPIMFSIRAGGADLGLKHKGTAVLRQKRHDL